ncbi:MAG TPA: DUF3108 domain-containing protein [Steroidobacteraceae bacterium]|nr:DUF3108 domain-containing protein [Steroidobacteraceae bacterium]
MRLPERVLPLLLLAAGAATSSVAMADPLDLKPFRATYTAEWKGMTAGTTVLELRNAGPEQYIYASTSNARGVFRMAFSETLTQISTFRLQDGAVQPMRFRGIDEKEREINLDFDWTKMKVTGVAKDHTIDLPLTAGAQDAMSLQIHVLRGLATGKVPATIWMIDADKLKDYELRLEGNARIETRLGELDTIVYTSKRANGDRLTRTWVAPALGYLPVKAERIRGKKTEFTLFIEAVDR